MVSTSRVIQLGLASLAALALSGWQTANAQTTCNTSAWSGVTGTPVAGGPNSTPTAVARYSGSCGLRAATSGNFVREATLHSAEGSTASPMHARFLVYTGVTAGSPVVFQSLDGTSAPVVTVTYDRLNQRFTFAAPGATASTANDSALANRWITVQFSYQAGQAFTAQTTSLDVVTAITPTAPLSGTAPAIEEVRLGGVSGTQTGALLFDEYEASRAIGSPSFTLLCRGDSNKDGNLNVFDAVGVVNERANGNLAAGQPDCNEDGAVNIFDAICVVNRRIANDTCI